MVRRHRAHVRRLSLAAVVVTLGAWVVSLSGPSVADVTAVKGSAYGYFASVSLFGGPPMTRGPAPTVTLPPAGSPTPITSSVDTALVQFGPAILFSSGPITVSTQGTTGPSGSVTSSSNIQNVNTSGQEVFTASSVASTCTASESGVSGSTTINNGTLVTSEGDPDVEGDETVVAIPTNPPPNTTYNGTIEAVGDTFQYIFNEQILGSDGSITVNAGHLKLLGPTAVGDLIIGHVECGVTAVPSSTTTTTVDSTTTTIPATTTTVPATTTTVPATTTTVPATTTTVPATTTTVPATTTTVPATTTTVPATTTTVPSTTTTTTQSFILTLICEVLRPLASLPFIGPFIAPLLAAFGCGPA